MTDRVARASGTTLVVAGIVGTIVTIAGWVPGGLDVVFPLSVVIGIVTLQVFRPRKRRRPQPKLGPLPERGTPENR